MKRFLVLYMMPAAGLEAWMKTDPEVRQKAENEMKTAWDAWMAAHADLFAEETKAAGKTKRLTKAGVTDVKNDVMMYSVIQAESPEAAATAFADNPHLNIPEAWIDIMPATALSEMEM